MQSWQRDCALEGSGILIREVAFYAFFAFLGCVERQVTPVGSLDAPPRRLSWTGRTVLLALEMRAVQHKAPGMCQDYELHFFYMIHLHNR